ncbi:MAG TPA: TIGR00730 family Rossman fold protein [Thermoanaerobaculia bacterium]|nr:TIGR00730 family Rossman fold protein [Thermoanaerobaculia bacterium]
MSAAEGGSRFRRLCVFCGSAVGRHPVYGEAARELARLASEASIELVTGGGRIGLMGVIANSALEAGGRVIGVIPRGLVAREQAHEELSELRIVDSMHERKALMAELSDGFVALPGGMGTLEEISEALTWLQLGIHQKPCALLNVDGYWDHWIAHLDHAVDEGFFKPEHRQLVLVEEDPSTLIERLASYRIPALPRWLPAAAT